MDRGGIMQSTWHRQVLFVWVGVRFAAHTTLGLRLLCRSGMIVWVRMYTPEKEGELTCFSMMRFDGRQATSKLLLSYHSRLQVDQACLSMIAVI